MKTNFIDFINEAKISDWYRGYEYIKDITKSPGEYGLWIIPELYYRDFANEIKKGFKSVSMIQCREAIDEWFDFSEKNKKIKEE
jgi:hypothetical protein